VLVLADTPETLTAVYPDAGDAARRSAAALPPAERSLWAALAGGDPCLHRPSAGAGGFWPRIVLVGEAAHSQFDVLRGLLAADPAAGCPVACLALAGRGFHGHRGRPWTALRGNLHLSAALAPDAPADRIGLALTMLPAVATVDALREVSGGALAPGIKWVNDILLEGRKVAGVLTSSQAQGSRLELAVLGIGLNVARTPPLVPTPFVPAAGCLRASPQGRHLALPDVFAALLAALARRAAELLREGPARLFAAYRAASLVIGRRVRVWPEGLDHTLPPATWPEPLAEGVVEEILPDLSLLLEGRSDPVSRGRLALVDGLAPARG
jgi:BirA family biotin operon repressor/biotin-[acetyl-CoA-carboxylase] ligase